MSKNASASVAKLLEGRVLARVLADDAATISGGDPGGGECTEALDLTSKGLTNDWDCHEE